MARKIREDQRGQNHDSITMTVGGHIASITIDRDSFEHIQKDSQGLRFRFDANSSRRHVLYGHDHGSLECNSARATTAPSNVINSEFYGVPEAKDDGLVLKICERWKNKMRTIFRHYLSPISHFDG